MVDLISDDPPEHIVELALEVAAWSPCRSKRGSVVFDRDRNVIAHGHNRKPQGFDCDGSAACKSTCRYEAIHAEQYALLTAGPRARGAQMLHVKAVDGRLVASGGPSCVQCSKLGFAAGVSGIWLYHEPGWTWYPVAEWHRLSLAANQSAVTAAPPVTEKQSPEVCICAAVDYGGDLVRGHRHHDAMRTAVERRRARTGTDEGATMVQGFITSRGRFVEREEGLRLQIAAGIPSKAKDGYRGDILFSEDLY